MQKFKKIQSLTFCLFIGFYLMGCESIQTRHQINRGQKPTKTQELETLPAEEETSVVEVKEKKLPKVGIILGPGSLRAVSQSGFLYSLEQNKIPIASVIGHEWGALIGAYFASQGRANEVQWQMGKMKKDVVGSMNFLSKTYDAKKVSEILPQIVKKDVINRDLNGSEISFACPTISYVVGKTLYKRGGKLGKLMERCMPYPPIVNSTGVWFADAFSIEKSIRYLKQQRMELIVYVNVLGEGDLFDKSKMKKHPEASLLWQQLSAHSAEIKSLRTKYPELKVVNISVSHQPLFEVKNMSLLTLAGKRAGDKFVEQIQEEYGF